MALTKKQRDTLEFLSDRIFEIAVLAAASKDPNHYGAEQFDKYDVDLLRSFAENFGSYISCAAEDGTFVADTFGGLECNIQNSFRKALGEKRCPHTACSQNFVDTGETKCVKDEPL